MSDVETGKRSGRVRNLEDEVAQARREFYGAFNAALFKPLSGDAEVILDDIFQMTVYRAIRVHDMRWRLIRDYVQTRIREVAMLACYWGHGTGEEPAEVTPEALKRSADSVVLHWREVNNCPFEKAMEGPEFTVCDGYQTYYS